MADDKTEEKKKELEITTTEEIKRGVFANQIVIRHGAEEFVMDFLYMTPPTGTLNSRIIITPGHFKRLIRAMEENLSKYEERFGEIIEQKKDISIN